MTGALPPPGRWALGADMRTRAEALLVAARAAGRRTAWLGLEAGFVSNLSVVENLRLMHEWQGGEAATFVQDLQGALDALLMPWPDWLHERPSGMDEAALVRARLLRVLLARPEVLVVNPVVLVLAGEAAGHRLLAALDSACILLLADTRATWPAWSPDAMASGPREDVSA